MTLVSLFFHNLFRFGFAFLKFKRAASKHRASKNYPSNRIYRIINSSLRGGRGESISRQRSCRDLCKFEGDKISFRCIIRYSQRRTQARAINCNHYESARLPDLRQFIIRYSGSKLSRNSIFPGRDKTQLRNSCPGTKIDYPYTFRGRCKIRNNSREKHRAVISTNAPIRSIQGLCCYVPRAFLIFHLSLLSNRPRWFSDRTMKYDTRVKKTRSRRRSSVSLV